MLTEAQAKQNVPANLCRILSDRKMTPRELSRRAQLSQSTVYAAYNGRNIPSAFVLRRIAEALDVSTDRLLDPPPEVATSGN